MSEMRPNHKNEGDLVPAAATEAEFVVLPWFAIQVRGHHEMGVGHRLTSYGFEWFLPTYKRRKRWSDRIKEEDAPLFPGYLFCRFDAQHRLPILTIPSVIQIVGYNRVPVAVEEAEIRAIQRLVASGLPNRPWPFCTVGDRVRIESGPLRSLEGILAKFKGAQRLVLSVTLLQRSVAVEIDSASVTPLGPSGSVPFGMEKADVDHSLAIVGA